MKHYLLHLLFFLLSLVLGSLVNMSVLELGQQLIPLPAGVNPENMDSYRTHQHLMEARHFLFPFLAHALGTLVAGFCAAKLARNHKMSYALGTGLIFLLAGLMMVFLIPAPIWFCATDLLLAYLPMAYWGGRLGTSKP